jgi:predicted DNA-binding WGR domain protein
MPRYEFSEGSSNKFWEINLSGKSFTTTYGKIGTSGQTTIKSWKDNAEAKTQYDKLIAEKSKKGYELVGGGKSKAPVDDDEDEDDDDDEEEAPAPKKKVAAKPAPKVAAKPAAKPAAKAAAAPKGARHFEFSEGSSNKFWEITLSGTDVKTKYGKIGTAGQQTLKEFGDAAAAKKEYDKLVHEKTKKGYVEGEAGGGGDDDGDDDDGDED